MRRGMAGAIFRKPQKCDGHHSYWQGADLASNPVNQEAPMRKFVFLAFTALFLVAGFAGWNAATNQESVAAPTKNPRMDVMQMMSAAKNLPTQQFIDHSLVHAGE
jgi:hypothetical protein